MEIGITLPNGAPGVDGRMLVEWGRRSEAAGFARLGAIGRIAYPTHEELVTFAAIAGATERIHLMTTTLLAAARDPVLLAKQAATLDRISGGRFTLGLSVGMRPDDFEHTHATFEDRGRRLDEMLGVMHRAWRGEALMDGSREVCPPPTGGRVPIMFGATSAAPPVIRRIARWGEGFIAAGSPRMVQPIVDALREAWADAGREGGPRLAAATYFALGEEAEAEAAANVRDYYAFFPEFGEMAAGAIARTPQACRLAIEVFTDAGFDELSFSAASAEPTQVERLAEAVL